MVRIHHSMRSNVGRKNSGLLSYYSICNVHVTKIRCHEKSKKHIMNYRQNVLGIHRSLHLSEVQEICTRITDTDLSRLERTTTERFDADQCESSGEQMPVNVVHQCNQEDDQSIGTVMRQE